MAVNQLNGLQSEYPGINTKASSRAPNEFHESEFDDKRAIRARGHWLRARVFTPSLTTQVVRALEGGREGWRERWKRRPLAFRSRGGA
jgi:hypothetical protein